MQTVQLQLLLHASVRLKSSNMKLVSFKEPERMTSLVSKSPFLKSKIFSQMEVILQA